MTETGKLTLEDLLKKYRDGTLLKEKEAAAKLKKKIYDKSYYNTHSEEIIKRQHNYYIKNREKRSKYDRDRYLEGKK